MSKGQESSSKHQCSTAREYLNFIFFETPDLGVVKATRITNDFLGRLVSSPSNSEEKTMESWTLLFFHHKLHPIV